MRTKFWWGAALCCALVACDEIQDVDLRDVEGDQGLGRVDKGVPDEAGPNDVGRRDAGPEDADMHTGRADFGPDQGADCIEDAVEECGACDGAVRICAAGQWSPCAPPAERCDGLDQDCDGRIDEAFPTLGDDCVSGRGGCSVAGHLVCAADGTEVQCSAVPAPAMPERCDATDDDCDGAVDEAAETLCWAGPPDARGVGRCRVGLAVCAGGRLGACEGAVLPQGERCNDADDDCDGRVDEGDLAQSCYAGPLGTEGVGRCRAGIRSCQGGVLGACVDQALPAAEICDGADNDCDGAADEGLADADCACARGEARACYSGPADTVGVGACRFGRQACGPDGRFGACGDEQHPEAEQCNGLDDDCDGAIDEAVPGMDAACEAGRGACARPGMRVCDAAAGALRCDAMPGAPGGEVCNGLDDDCDGAVDDGFDVGADCAVGEGACRAEGTLRCNAAGGVHCAARPGQPAPELCDGADNDCDGLTDEGFDLGDPCAVGVGACAREAAAVCDAAGQVVCGDGPGDPQPEACNAVDDDCDGTVDEGDPGGDQPCDTGAPGACAVGRLHCKAGGFVCVAAVAPMPEVCDGQDNDCDGERDEDAGGDPLAMACYEGAPGTEDVGRCQAGVQRCADGMFGPCVGQVVPGVEICNQADDDCNGVVDDVEGVACVCGPGDRQQCYTGPDGSAGVGICRRGSQRCLDDGSGFGPCEGEVVPGAEICNGLDDDCDGMIDDVPGLGAPCAAGVGACAVEGRQRCRGGNLRCDAEPAAPVAEQCNGLDDDCNGVVDDLAGLGDRCVAGEGACAREGNQRCDRNMLVCSAEAGAPRPERCNGLDDDCDGIIDEDIAEVGVRCTVGMGLCRRAGNTACDGPSGEVGCDAEPGAAAAERCNGLDDDCDGLTDEQVPEVGQACAEGQGACAAEGVTRCAAGRLACDAEAGDPGAEICSGLDDDCDGRVDEGLPCRLFRSCQHALDQGFDTDGIYRIDPDGDALAGVDVWCDQTTDGGGWTLVASTRGQTLNDEAGAWHPDLRTLAPAEARTYVWDGMRPRIPADGDIRFACRDAVAANAPFTVDLSFYRASWYREITTGADGRSCFSEGNGDGADPPPGRRNNRTGEIRAPGQGWHSQASRFLEGEDACADTGDFTVDFEDRGMDGDQSDGTDWGEDDGVRKCGTSGLGDGQWFIFVREPQDHPLARVAVLEATGLLAPLRAAGFAVTAFDLDAFPPGTDLRGFDAVFLGRYAPRWSRITPALTAALDAYSRAGGHLITEWDGLSMLAQRYRDDFRYRLGAPDPWGWFPFNLGAGQSRGADTEITPTVPADPIVRSLGDRFSGGDGTENFFTLYPTDLGVATHLRAIAHFPGGVPPLFPNPTHDAILRGVRCGGHVVLAVFDYQDPPAQPAIAQLIANLAAAVSSPVDPDAFDVCPPELP